MEPLYTFTNVVAGLQAAVLAAGDGRYAVRLVDLNTGRPFRPVPVSRTLVAAVEHAGAVIDSRETVMSV